MAPGILKFTFLFCNPYGALASRRRYESRVRAIAFLKCRKGCEKKTTFSGCLGRYRRAKRSFCFFGHLGMGLWLCEPSESPESEWTKWVHGPGVRTHSTAPEPRGRYVYTRQTPSNYRTTARKYQGEILQPFNYSSLNSSA